MIGRLGNVVRGTVAWIVGYLLTVALAAVGVVDTGGGLIGGSAAAFVGAHALPPAVDGESLLLVAVPVLAVGTVGYRAGARRGSGLLGRFRSLLESVRGGERSRGRDALRCGAFLAVGYALTAAVVALPLAAGVGDAAIRAFAVALVVAAPAAYLGAVR